MKKDKKAKCNSSEQRDSEKDEPKTRQVIKIDQIFVECLNDSPLQENVRIVDSQEIEFNSLENEDVVVLRCKLDT